jgi:hypothetical protein
MYRVRWDIDLEADTPAEAVMLAQEIQRDPESTSTHFDVSVLEHPLTFTCFDLEEPGLQCHGLSRDYEYTLPNDRVLKVILSPETIRINAIDEAGVAHHLLHTLDEWYALASMGMLLPRRDRAPKGTHD